LGGGEGVEVDGAVVRPAPQLGEELEGTERIDAGDREAVVVLPVAVVEVDAEQPAAGERERRRRRRPLARHQGVAEVEGDADVRQADVGGEQERLTHRADQRDEGVAAIGWLVLDADPHGGRVVGHAADPVDRRCPGRRVVDVERPARAVVLQPEDDVIGAEPRRQIDRVDADGDCCRSGFRVGTGEGAVLEARVVEAEVDSGEPQAGGGEELGEVCLGETA
jgi:hypothetical protein